MSKLTVVQLDPTLDPWERQPEESQTRYGQFCTYRDQGRTRSLRKAAETLTKNDRYVRDVAAAFKWRERAEAYDRHLDELHRGQLLDERRKAAEADAAILRVAIGKIAQRLQSMQVEHLSNADLIRMLDVVMRHRRQLLGDNTVQVNATVRQVDSRDAELIELLNEALAQEAAQDGSP